MKRTATVFTVLILALVFSTPQVWAQENPQEMLTQFLNWAKTQQERDSRSLEAIAAAQQQQAEDTRALRNTMIGLGAPQRQAQATAPTAAQSAPASASCNYTDPNLQAICQIAVRAEGKADWSVQQHQTLAGDVATLQKDVKSLKGRIAPRPAATPATPAPIPSDKPAAPSAAATVKSCGQECLRAVKFSGSDPNLADVDKIRDLVGGGRYEVVDLVRLPLPTGGDDRSRGLLKDARDANLGRALGRSIGVREPADQEEAAELVAGAPGGTGVVFHLRLKKTTTAATPTTP